MGPNPRQQLARAERLRDVVVAADLQSQHTIELLASGREEEDRNIGCGCIRAELAAEVEAVAIGQHDVQKDQVRAVILDRLKGSGQPVEYYNRIAVVTEVVLEEGTKISIVFDDDDGLLHPSSPIVYRAQASVSLGGQSGPHRPVANSHRGPVMAKIQDCVHGRGR